MIVEELLATLGVHVDVESFVEAEGWTGKLKAGLVALVTGLGLYELHHMVKEVAELGDAATKSSQKLGVSAEALQELGYAAKLSDVSQQALEGALFRLSRNLERMSTHAKGPAADALKKLHLNAKDLKNEGLEGSLETIAEAFSKLPDGQQKAALAMQLFGGAGKKLIPFLNEGRQGIIELREEARKLGIVIAEDTAKRFEEFNDDQTRVSEAWRGMKVQIVSDLLPSLHDMTVGMLKWLEANGEWIRSGIHAVIQGVIIAFQALGAVIDEVVSFTKSLVKFMGEHRDLTLVVTGLILAYLMPALLSLAVTLGVVAAEFFVINAPIILLVSAITSLIILVNHWGDIWPIVADKVSRAWSSIVSGAKGALTALGNAVLSGVNFIVDAFASLGEKVITAIVKAWDYVLYKTGELVEGIARKIEGIPVIGKVLKLVGLTTVAPVAAAASGAAESQQAEAVRDDVMSKIPSQFQQFVPTPATNTFSATLGDTSIVVNPSAGMDEQKVGEIAAKKVAEAQRNMLTDAYDRMRGGRQ